MRSRGRATHAQGDADARRFLHSAPRSVRMGIQGPWPIWDPGTTLGVSPPFSIFPRFDEAVLPGNGSIMLETIPPEYCGIGCGRLGICLCFFGCETWLTGEVLRRQLHHLVRIGPQPSTSTPPPPPNPPISADWFFRREVSSWSLRALRHVHFEEFGALRSLIQAGVSGVRCCRC